MLSGLIPSKIKSYASLVKFSHSVFALPFALAMLLLLLRREQATFSQIFFIITAIVSARTAAMSFNRLVDREVDAKNPRTSQRELPSGALTSREAWALLLFSSLVFLGCAAMLGKHCLILAPFVLILLLAYSLTKRFTSLSHLVLGLALALAPGGVWYAITASFSFVPLPLMGAIVCWVAGFDILYSCQDVEFDRQHNLYSIPSRFGVTSALRIARLLHSLSICGLLYFGVLMACGFFYFVGVLIFAALLLSQHLLLRPNDLSRIDAAFFIRNAQASLVYFFAVLTDSLLG